MPKVNSIQQKEKNEHWDLLDVYNCPEKICSTMGVILDSTGCYKTNTSYDFVIKMRIIDNTFNCDTMPIVECHPFIIIFLYFNQKTKSKPIPKLGDVILLRNFIFDKNKYKDKIYLMGSFNMSCSSWHIFEGNEGSANTPFLESKNGYKIFWEEKEKLEKLRSFRTKLFTRKSLEDVCWYKFQLPKNIDDYPIIFMKDIDIILRLITIFKVTYQKDTYLKLALVDKTNMMYFAEIKSSEISLKEGAVYKLRSICIPEEKNSKSKRILYYEHSAILRIPDCYKDSKDLVKSTTNVKYSVEQLEKQFFTEMHLDKYFKESFDWGISVFNTVDKSFEQFEKSAIGHFPLLGEYDLDQVFIESPMNPSNSTKKKTCSIFKKEHSNLPITPLKVVADILAKCNQKESSARNYGGRTFRVSVKIKSVGTYLINEYCQYFDKKTENFAALNELANFQKKNQVDQIILKNHFMVSDKTLEKDCFIPVYLFTDDGNPQNIFSLWNVLENVEDVNEFLDNIGEYEEKIETNFEKILLSENKFDMILKFVEIEGGKSYIKIIDTLFWFVG